MGNLSEKNKIVQWTYDNHLVCGFHRNSSGAIDQNIYFSKVGSASRKVFTAFEEAQMAAALIYREARKIRQELFLCLSGGIDSEAMLRAFLSAGVPFQGIIMRFNDNLNDFDIKDIIQFCDKNRIPYEIFNLNVLDFFESERYLQYGQMYQCQSPQLATHLYLCDHIKGCPVLSWQPPEVYFYFDRQKQIQTFSFGIPGHLHSVLLRYFVKKRRLGVPFFFLYTTALLKAFFKLPLLQKMIWFGRKGFDVYYSYDIKCMTYKQAGFSVEPRKDSYTGFEKLKNYYDLLDRKSYGLGFNDRYRTPLEKLNPLPKGFYQIVPQDMLYHLSEIQKLDEMYESYLQEHFLVNSKM